MQNSEVKVTESSEDGGARAEPRRAAIVGEIQFCGRAVVRAFLRKGLAVRVLCPDKAAELAVLSERDAATTGGDVQIVQGDLGSDEALRRICQDVYGVCMLSPINFNGRMYRARTHLEDVRRVTKAAEEAALRKLVYHSALGAHPDAFSQALRDAFAAEEILHESRCEDFRVRTGMLMGRNDGFLAEILGAAKKGPPFTTVLGYGSTPIQPLHVDDFARCMTRFILPQPEEPQPGYYSLAGPQLMTVLDLMDDAETRLRRRKLRFHAPLFVLQLIANIRGGDNFKERVNLLLDGFYTEKNDALKLLGPGEKLRTPHETQEEILAAQA